MRRILAPLDITKSTDPALSGAISIAKKCDAELHIVEFLPQNVVGFREEDKTVFETGYESQEMLSAKIVKEHADRVNKYASFYRSKGISVKSEIINDNFKSGISDYVDSNHIDLIIINAPCKCDLIESLRGNRIEIAIESNNCAVLSIHNHFDLEALNKMVIAVDFYKEYSPGIWNRIHDIRTCFDAKLYFIYIKVKEVDQVELNNKVFEFKKKHDFDNYQVNFLESDTIEEKIIHYAESKNAGLIGMITNAPAGFLRIFNHSVSESVVNNSELPVLTINE